MNKKTVSQKYLKARNLHQNKELEAAIAIYQDLIQCVPNFAWYHYDLGKAYQQLGKLEKAITSYCRAIELNPKLGTCYCDLGKAFLEMSHIEQAIEAYRCAIALKPNRTIKLSGKSGGYKFLRNILEKSSPGENFFNLIDEISDNLDINELILIVSYLYPYKNKFNRTPYQARFYSLYNHIRETLTRRILPEKLKTNIFLEHSSSMKTSNFTFFLIVDILPNSIDSSHARLFFDTLIKIKEEFKNHFFFIIIANESFACKRNSIYVQYKDQGSWSSKSLEKFSKLSKILTSGYLLPHEFEIISVNWNAFGQDYQRVLHETISFIRNQNPRFIIFPSGLYCSYIFSKIFYEIYPTLFFQTNQNDPVLNPHTLHITHGYQNSFENFKYSYSWRNCFRSIDIYELEQIKNHQKRLSFSKDNKIVNIITFGRCLEKRLDQDFINIVESVTLKFKNVCWDLVGFTSLNILKNSMYQSLIANKNCQFYECVPYSNFRDLLVKYDLVCAPNHSGNASGILNAYLLGLEIFCFAQSDVQSLLLDYSIYSNSYESYKKKLVNYLKHNQKGNKIKAQISKLRFNQYINWEDKLARKNLNVIINEAISLHKLSLLKKSAYPSL